MISGISLFVGNRFIPQSPYVINAVSFMLKHITNVANKLDL